MSTRLHLSGVSLGYAMTQGEACSFSSEQTEAQFCQHDLTSVSEHS